ncbi:MAG: hypothetical protein L0Y56_07310 [Nitrospira sp.]|nr:hypothetical protein [Nitrospira sp.]
MITLKTLKQAKAQAVFNQLAVHLLTQNEKSVNRKGEPQYRGPRGLKCPGGCLMADDEYKLSFEGLSWYYLAGGDQVPGRHCFLIASLQNVHDGITPPDWLEGLRILARRFDLKTKCLDKLEDNI